MLNSLKMNFRLDIEKKRAMFCMPEEEILPRVAEHMVRVSPLGCIRAMHTCTVTFTHFMFILDQYCTCTAVFFLSFDQVGSYAFLIVKRNTGKMLLSFCRAFFKAVTAFATVVFTKEKRCFMQFSHLSFVCSILFYNIISNDFLRYIQIFSFTLIIMKYGVKRKTHHSTSRINL